MFYSVVFYPNNSAVYNFVIEAENEEKAFKTAQTEFLKLKPFGDWRCGITSEPKLNLMDDKGKKVDVGGEAVTFKRQDTGDEIWKDVVKFREKIVKKIWDKNNDINSNTKLQNK